MISVEGEDESRYDLLTLLYFYELIPIYLILIIVVRN